MNKLDRVEKFYMKLSQADFEQKALLEMLDFATKELQPDINKARRFYRYLFTVNGQPINSLR